MGTSIDSQSSASSALDVSLKETFDIYQKQSDSLHKLWVYFQVVSIAVLGYTIGSEKLIWSSWAYVFIGISYSLFAIANQWTLVLSQAELENFSNAVKMASDQTPRVGRLLKVTAVSARRVKLFHTFSALVVIGAIGFAWHDKCTGEWSCPKAQAATKKQGPVTSSPSINNSDNLNSGIGKSCSSPVIFFCTLGGNQIPQAKSG